MAARASGASAVDSYTVPDWVKRNSQLFKTPPPGFDSSTVKRRTAAEREALVASLFNAGGQLLNAGVGGSELTSYEPANIDLPDSPQPAEYWTNVENHGNILVTFMSTARQAAGFTPELSGSEFTKEDAEEYTSKFNAWLAELESYVGYIELVDMAQQTATNNSVDCNVILSGVSAFIVGVAGLIGTVAEAVAASITSLVTSAANYATQNGTAVNAGFTIETTETRGTWDPLQPISFASTYMSKNQSGKTIVESSSITMAAFTYKLNSAGIISMAEQLAAGSTLSGSKQYRDYVNGPINTFENSSKSSSRKL